MNFFKKAPIDFSKGKKTPLKTAVVAGVGILSALYILSPTFGIFELIPDGIPFIGNLDEFTAAMLIISSLKYFGIDLINMFTGNSDKEESNISNKTDEPRYEPPNKQ